MPSRVTIAFQTDKPLSAYGPLATQVEGYGFDGISVYNDLLYQPAWLPLLEIARATQHMAIGAAAVNPFTSHPINIAGNLALIDAASHQRVYGGFARGAWLDFLGLNPTHPVAALREAMICVRHLLRGDKRPLPGEHFPLQGGDTLRWSDIRANIPFLLGSWGPQTIRACLPLVSEVKLGGTANPGAARQLRSLLEERDSEVGVVIGAVTVVDEDGAAARNLARREVALYLPVIVELDKSLAIDPERVAGIRGAMARFDVEAAMTFISDDLLKKFAFAGTPDDIAEQVQALFDAGANRVELGTPHGLTSESGLRLLGEFVLPQVRSH